MSGSDPGPSAGISSKAPQEEWLQRYGKLENKLISSPGGLDQLPAKDIPLMTETGEDVARGGLASGWKHPPRAPPDVNTHQGRFGFLHPWSSRSGKTGRRLPNRAGATATVRIIPEDAAMMGARAKAQKI